MVYSHLRDYLRCRLKYVHCISLRCIDDLLTIFTQCAGSVTDRQGRRTDG